MRGRQISKEERGGRAYERPDGLTADGDLENVAGRFLSLPVSGGRSRRKYKRDKLMFMADVASSRFARAIGGLRKDLHPSLRSCVTIVNIQ